MGMKLPISRAVVVNLPDIGGPTLTLPKGHTYYSVNVMLQQAMRQFRHATGDGQRLRACYKR